MTTPEAQAAGEAPAKENQVALGSAQTRAPASRVERSWLARHFSLLLRRDRQAQKAGQLFSGLLALNVVLLGGAFICSMVFNNVAVTLGDVWILLAALKVLSALWLLYYTAGTTRRPHAVLHQDPHAGPVWVRGERPGTRGGGARCRGRGRGGPRSGRCQRPPPPARPGSLVLFGSCTVCLNVFRVGYDVSHIRCKSQLELVFPAIEVIFISVQVTGLAHPAPHPMPRNSRISKRLHGPEEMHTHHPPP